MASEENCRGAVEYALSPCECITHRRHLPVEMLYRLLFLHYRADVVDESNLADYEKHLTIWKRYNGALTKVWVIIVLSYALMKYDEKKVLSRKCNNKLPLPARRQVRYFLFAESNYHIFANYQLLEFNLEVKRLLSHRRQAREGHRQRNYRTLKENRRTDNRLARATLFY